MTLMSHVLSHPQRELQYMGGLCEWLEIVVSHTSISYSTTAHDCLDYNFDLG